MTSPRTILSAIAVAAALTIGLAPAAHAGTTDPSDAVGTASPEPSPPPDTDGPVVEPTDDPSPTAEPSTKPTTVAPTTTVATTQPQSTTTAPASTTTPAATSTTTSSGTPTSGTTTTSVSSTTSTTTAPVFYEHCNAVHDAGQPFLFAWEPGYRQELDRDLDGIACEWRENPDGNDESTDNDWRTLIVVIPVIDQSSTSYTYYGDDDLDATYTQWHTVPDGPIATGQS